MEPGDWDAKYRERPLLWSAGPNRFVVEEVAGLEPGTALDVACGEGRNAVWLAEQGWSVTGVDFSSVALDRARDMAAEHQVEIEWVEADLTVWEPAEGYDLVVVAYVHLPSVELQALLAKVATWINPGGRLVLIGHDRATAGVSGPSDPDLLWDLDLVVAVVAPLKVERGRVAYRTVESGEEAADTVVVARR